MNSDAYTVVEWPSWQVKLPPAGRYEFVAARGWHLLQRACIATLARLKCEVQEYGEHWSQRTYRTREIGEAIVKQHHELMRMLVIDRDNICILVGHKEFCDLTQRGDFARPGAPFSLDVSARIGVRDMGVSVYGFRVVVVPWVTGVHLVPTRYFK